MGAGATLEFNVLWFRDGRQERSIVRKWGDNVSNGNDWLEWLLSFNKGKEDQILYRDKNLGYGKAFVSDYMVDKCREAKLELKDSVDNRNGEKRIRNQDIKFWVNEETCEKTDNSVTCDLLFSPDSELKWKNEFKPRITFSK